MRDTAMQLGAVTAALAHPIRLHLVTELSNRGAVSTTALTGDSRVSRQALVKHLAVLEQAGLVTSRKRGRNKVYFLRTDTLTSAAASLAELGSVHRDD